MAANENTHRAKALDRQVQNYTAAVGALVDSVALSAPIEGWLAAQRKLIDRLAGFEGDDLADEAWAIVRKTTKMMIPGINHGTLHSEVRERVLGRLLEQQARLTHAPADPFASILAAAGWDN